MHLVLPAHPLRRTEVDPGFIDESRAARECGFKIHLMHHELLVEGNAKQAVKHIGEFASPANAIFRGWMLREQAYRDLWNELAARGLRLIVTPEQYATLHYLPNAYPHLEGHTPATGWIEGHALDDAWSLYRPFSDDDAIIKDFVKSAKHLWDEACFIPRHTERSRFEQIVRTFVNERGNLFERGLVIRRFEPLHSSGRDMRGHLRTNEVRLFFYHHKVLVPLQPGFELPGDYMRRITEIAGRLDNPFFSMDIAETADGGHVIIEVGDGGVSGLPVSLLPETFYAALAEGWMNSV